MHAASWLLLPRCQASILPHRPCVWILQVQHVIHARGAPAPLVQVPAAALPPFAIVGYAHHQLAVHASAGDGDAADAHALL